jgi:polyhydroxyalkanoate synthesis regulator phasin
MKAIQFIYSAMLTVVMSSYAFAQATPPASPNNALPDGPGKPIVVRACVGCHSLKVVVSQKATREDWSKIVNEMVTRGADLSDDEIDKVIEYLSTNFKPDDAKIEQSTTQTKMNLFQSLDQLAGVGPIARRRALSLAQFMPPFPEMQFRSRSPGDHINSASH